MLWWANSRSLVSSTNIAASSNANGIPHHGRTGFDIVAAVPSAVTGEPEEARARLRSELISYFSLPFYRAMLERSGFEATRVWTDPQRWFAVIHAQAA